MTTGKTIALTRWTLIGKVMSLLFDMLSRLIITFLPRSKRLLISRLQSPSAVILEPKKIKSDTVSTVSPSMSHEVMGPDAMIFVFWMLSFKPNFHSPLSLSSRGFLTLTRFLFFFTVEWVLYSQEGPNLDHDIFSFFCSHGFEMLIFYQSVFYILKL